MLASAVTEGVPVVMPLGQFRWGFVMEELTSDGVVELLRTAEGAEGLID